MTENRDQYLADVFASSSPRTSAGSSSATTTSITPATSTPSWTAAPNATLVINWFMSERMGASARCARPAVGAGCDGDTFDVGDRILHAVRPPDLRLAHDPRPVRPDDRRLLGIRRLRLADARPVRHVASSTATCWARGHPHVRPVRQPVARARRRRQVPAHRRPHRGAQPHGARRLPHAGDRPSTSSPTPSPPPAMPHRRRSRRSPTSPCSTPSRPCSSPPPESRSPRAAGMPAPNCLLTQASMKKIGFLNFGHWTPSPSSKVRTAADSLLQSIELAVAAEELGADGAYFRVHHFARQLASPFPLLAAIGARTSRIEIGTGVIDMRYENPLYMAEDAGAADLIAGGRLQLGISRGLARAGHRRLALLRLPARRRRRRRRRDGPPAHRGVPPGHRGRGLRPAEPTPDVRQPARAAARRAVLRRGCATASGGAPARTPRRSGRRRSA